MNCKQTQKISIQKVLESFSLLPIKKSKRGAFYFSIDREEDTPSLHVDFKKNTAHDFGSGKNYDNVSIVQTIKKCSISEALKYLEQFYFSFPKQENLVVLEKKKNKPIRIGKIIPVEHSALLSYIKKRKVIKQKEYIKEIHYSTNDKYYFGIGFKNDSNGYEIRNKYAKICLGKKDITTIKNGSNTLRVFEGFFDYLSFLNIEKALEKAPSDYLILNSIAMVNRMEPHLNSYKNIELYLDNDEAGNRATNEIKTLFEYSEDNRFLYRDFKDLNDWMKRRD